MTKGTQYLYVTAEHENGVIECFHIPCPIIDGLPCWQTLEAYKNMCNLKTLIPLWECETIEEPRELYW